KVILGFLCVLLAVVISLTIGWRPFLGPPKRVLMNRHFESTSERLARGRYLTQGLLGCETCHSPKDCGKPGAPTVSGMELAGQVLPIPGLPAMAAASPKNKPSPMPYPIPKTIAYVRSRKQSQWAMLAAQQVIGELQTSGTSRGAGNTDGSDKSSPNLDWAIAQ